MKKEEKTIYMCNSRINRLKNEKLLYNMKLGCSAELYTSFSGGNYILKLTKKNI